jgi:hypothetical protein
MLWYETVSVCWILAFLPGFLLLHLTAMRPARGDDETLEIAGANRKFSDTLAEMLKAARLAGRPRRREDV